MPLVVLFLRFGLFWSQCWGTSLRRHLALALALVAVDVVVEVYWLLLIAGLFQALFPAIEEALVELTLHRRVVEGAVVGHVMVAAGDES